MLSEAELEQVRTEVRRHAGRCTECERLKALAIKRGHQVDGLRAELDSQAETSGQILSQLADAIGFDEAYGQTIVDFASTLKQDEANFRRFIDLAVVALGGGIAYANLPEQLRMLVAERASLAEKLDAVKENQARHAANIANSGRLLQTCVEALTFYAGTPSEAIRDDGAVAMKALKEVLPDRSSFESSGNSGQLDWAARHCVNCGGDIDGFRFYATTAGPACCKSCALSAPEAEAQ